MWIPKNENDIISAVSNGSLEETEIFDAKKEIPAKNVETAKDISAMANSSGGVIIYGLDEDESGHPTVLSPFELEGKREKIDQIVRTSVSEVPYYNISAIPTQNDSTKGYLIVVVPPSERAPHMVIVKGEKRYYGRGETGNYILNEFEVAILYERRKLINTTILPVLEKMVRNSPIKEHSGFSHLHIITKPVLEDDNILLNALSEGEKPENLLHNLIKYILNSDIFTDNYSPDFTQPSNWIRRPEGYLGKLHYSDESNSRQSAHTLYLQVNLDGSGSLFCGRAAENQRDGYPPKFFFSGIVAGNTVKFLALLGELYERATYFGKVDIGIALTGLQNCVPYETRNRFFDLPRYENSEYHKTLRTSAVLLKEDTRKIAADLLMPLIDAISQGTDNPFR